MQIHASDNPMDSLTAAYDEYSDAIFRHCYFRVFNRELAKELVQETFMRTWEYISQGNNVDNVRAFLYRVANNLIVDAVRKKKETSLEAMQEEGFDPGIDETEHMQNMVDGRSVIATLSKLDKTYRDILVMRYVDGLTPSDIAEMIGESPNTVSVRIHRGLKQLKALVKNGSAA